MFKKFLPWYLLGLVVLSLAFIYGCGAAPTSGGGGGSLSNRVGTYSYNGTQSPGDVWAWTISTETFFGSCESGEQAGFWVTGTWQTLPSGFGKAHVSDSQGGTADDSYAYFLEFPNTMLIVKPLSEGGDKDRVMVCAASATQEPAQGTYLYINIPKKGWDDGYSALGSVEVTESGDKWRFVVSQYLVTGEYIDYEDSDYHNIFTNGTFTDETGGSTEVFMTPSSVFFGDSGPNQGGFAGASLEVISTYLLTTEVMNHTFLGARFLYNPTTGTGETEPVKITKIVTMDAMWGGSVNVETGTEDPDKGHVMITFEAQQPNGFFKGNVSSYDLTGAYMGYQMVQGIIAQIGPPEKRKYMFFGIGYEYDSGRVFNFLTIQKPN